MVREGVAFLEHHRESLDGESLVARLFETMMAAAPIEQTLTLEQVLRQLHELEIKAGFSIIIEGRTFYDFEHEHEALDRRSPGRHQGGDYVPA